MSILLKHTTLGNKHLREIENENLARKINEDRIFEAKIEDPLEEIIEITDLLDIEHKKSMFPYDEPTIETADEIETKQKLIDDDFTDLQSKFDQPNDIFTEQNKEKEIEDLIDDTIKDKDPFSTFDDFWWEEELFSKKDSKPTVEASTEFLKEIDEMSKNIL